VQVTNQAEFNADDFGVIAWREDDVWRASRLANTRDLGSIMDQLKAQQGDGGSIALISIDEEFFLIARCTGRTMQMMLSDVTYAGEYEVAADVIDALDLPFPEEEDIPQPGGDVDLLADFGISAMELEVMSDDLEMYPEEQITTLAHRLGFGEQFDQHYDRN
jgi:putative tRNA adenosine deaminase-associated protein